MGRVNRGVLSMRAFPTSGVQPTHLYLAKFSNKMPPNNGYAVPPNFIHNEISVAHIDYIEDTGKIGNLQDVVLAGGLGQMGSAGCTKPSCEPQSSVDGVGTEVRFTFIYCTGTGSMGNGARSLDNFDSHYGGATLDIMIDGRTNRIYLVVGEGSGHKIRLVDVTTNTPEKAKVVTLASIVGPIAVGMGGPDDMFALDSQGMLLNIDAMPAVPCGNMWKFTNVALRSWNCTKGASSCLLNSTHTYHLRRAAAANTSKAVPWTLDVMKKVKTVWNRSAVKEVACAKPNGAPGTNCCVRKYINSGSDAPLTSAEQSDLAGLLASL